MSRPSSTTYRLIERAVTHVLPHERALQRAAGFPPMTTGTYPVRDLVAHFRALRRHQMRMARLCATDAARREYVDYAWAASWQVRAQKAARRAHVAQFGVMQEGALFLAQAS
jgi:hypothetical protein